MVNTFSCITSINVKKKNKKKKHITAVCILICIILTGLTDKYFYFQIPILNLSALIFNVYMVY